MDRRHRRRGWPQCSRARARHRPARFDSGTARPRPSRPGLHQAPDRRRPGRVRQSVSVGRHRLRHRHARRPARRLGRGRVRRARPASWWPAPPSSAPASAPRASWPRGRTIVQACRRSGRARTARLAVVSTAVDVPQEPREAVAGPRVCVPTARAQARADEDGPRPDRARRRAATSRWSCTAPQDAAAARGQVPTSTQIADLRRPGLADRRAERRRSAARQASALPSGRGTYRRLDDYNQEMKTLVGQNPDLVKPITLPFKTLTGLGAGHRDHRGRRRRATASRCSSRWAPTTPASGPRPSTRWSGPTSWSTATRPTTRGSRRLMNATRTIVVPVVNPEGFNTSREAGRGRRRRRRTTAGDDTGETAEPARSRTSTSARTAA